MPRILLVDDNTWARMAQRMILTADGYTVVDVSDGRDALEILLNGGDKFDAVLTDFQMPGMDGVELIQKMQDDPTLRRIPVILSSGGGDGKRDPAVEAKRLGVVFLPKPASVLDLCTAVTKRLLQAAHENLSTLSR